MKQYLDFLNAASILLIPFDNTAKHLLEEVALSAYEGTDLTVTGAMEMAHVASPATVHRKIDDLLTSGYISLEYKDKDRRTKYLKLTNLGVRYFEKLNDMMLKAAK